jgi:hypothetical protein
MRPWLTKSVLLVLQETLNQRTHVLEEAQAASKAAINKRRVVERMKGSSNINPSKVDDALDDMRDVSLEPVRICLLNM